jgi:thioredoxin-related protein
VIRRLFLGALLLLGTLWAESIVKFSKEIKATGRPVMLIFDSKGCPYCERLEKELDKVEFLHKVAKEFDIYRIPRDEPQSYMIFGEPTTTQTLQMIFKVKVTPYLVIFNSKGEKMWQIPGYTDAFLLTKILKFVKGVDEGKYKKSEWKKYLLDQDLIKEGGYH